MLGEITRKGKRVISRVLGGREETEGERRKKEELELTCPPRRGSRSCVFQQAR